MALFQEWLEFVDFKDLLGTISVIEITNEREDAIVERISCYCGVVDGKGD